MAKKVQVRWVAGFLIAPLFAPPAVVIALGIWEAIRLQQLQNLLNSLYLLPLTAIVLPQAYVAAFTIGLPAIILLRHFDSLSRLTAILVGACIPLLWAGAMWENSPLSHMTLIRDLGCYVLGGICSGVVFAFVAIANSPLDVDATRRLT